MKNPSAKILSPSSLEDPGEAGSRIPDADNSWQASNSIRSLLQSLVQCMDIELVSLPPPFIIPSQKSCYIILEPLLVM